MKKTTILFALLAVIVQGACANGKGQAAEKEQLNQAGISQGVSAQQGAYELPVLGNFQIDSRGDTITIVFFCVCHILRISFCMVIRVSASSAPKGSSRSRSEGLFIKALAIATLCDIPPESCLGY